MLLHGNARLSPFQRQLVCERVRFEGWTIEEAAHAAGCSQRTVYRWLVRHDAGDSMLDRSSAPHRRPTRTPAQVERQIERLRRLRWTSTKIAATLDMAVSTVCAVLARLGLNRLWKLEPSEPPNRYCRRHAGELVHLDVKKLGRFKRPGHRVRGRGPGRKTYRAGWEAVHVCVDDATRLAYVEILPDEKAVTTIGFFDRAIAWFAERGVKIRQVMSDNGVAYKSAPFALWCSQQRIEHIRTRPYRPRTNGKAEASSRRCCANGPTRRRIAPPNTEPARSPPGSTTTTTNDHTAPSATSRPPAAFTATDQRHWDLHLG